MIETVAIKLADGNLYPLLNSKFQGHMRVVITTEVDAQEEARVEFFRGTGSDMEDPVQLDILILENITARPKGDLDLTLILSISSEQILEVTLSDPLSGNSASKSIHLQSSQAPIMLESFETTDTSSNIEEVTDTKEAQEPIDSEFIAGIDPQVSYDRIDKIKERGKRGGSFKKKAVALAVALCVVGVLCAILLLAYLFFESLRVPPLPPLVA